MEDGDVEKFGVLWAASCRITNKLRNMPR